jgi:hypothetical protein
MIDCEYHNLTHLVNHDDYYDGEESMHRLLASSPEEEVYLNHATIGVVVVTLALLFVVDVIRHGVSFKFPPFPHMLICGRFILQI